MIESRNDKGKRPLAAIESFQLFRRTPGREDQLRARIGVNTPLDENDNAIVGPAVKQARPEVNGIARKTQLVANAAQKLGKNDVDGDGIRIETIRARAEDDIVTQSADSAIPSAVNLVGSEPPEKVEEVRPRQFGNAMPGEKLRIEILHILAVNVDIEFGGQLRDPFDDDAFGAVALIKKRRNNGHSRFRFRLVHVIKTRIRPARLVVEPARRWVWPWPRSPAGETGRPQGAKGTHCK